ncbi:MAG TPA: ubiquinol-cytochrome c reductase iron-sulfur subunit [Steroidobacteraceae bacterium]|jgi:ubiquinol-cytochrome c reductase iron-sulfur subunit
MTDGDGVGSIMELEPDLSRRRVLRRATWTLGAVGAFFTLIPFVESWLPSERARAVGGPVTVDPTKIDPGQMVIVIWRRQPIYLVRRTAQMLMQLGGHDARLKDPGSQNSAQPSYADNPLRSRRSDLFVTIGICTHLGCLPKARFSPAQVDLGADWPGGFLCPCHGSRFDLAGRVFDGSPASVNLVIPPYYFSPAGMLVVGEDHPPSA